jgi:nitrogen fixation protein NifX
MAKVAVASTDGILIDEHFGRAKQFLVFDVDEQGEYTFLEKRSAGNISGLDCHSVDYIVPLLADVEAVLAVQIGQAAERILRRQGIFALPVEGPIEQALHLYGQRSKFIKTGVRVGLSREKISVGSC